MSFGNSARAETGVDKERKREEKRMGIREGKKENSELFKWDGKPTLGQILPLAAQHVLAAVVGCVTPAILVANAANNAGGNVDMGLLIQMSLVFAALSTLLQLYGNKVRMGSGLPVIIGVSFAYVPTMTAIAAQAKSIDTILGAMLIGGVVAIIVGLTIKQIRKVFPPLVIGTVIFAIGLSLYKTAINYMAGNPANTYEVIVEQQGKTSALVFGSWQNWLVSFVTLAIVVALNHYGKGLFKLASILIGLLCGYVLALCFGMVDFSVLSNAGWFQIPKPLEFGMRFEISAIIPLAILFLVNSIQAMGDFSATTSGGMDRLPTDKELNGGIIGYGVGNIVSAFFGCPPTATFSQNGRNCRNNESCFQKSLCSIGGNPFSSRSDSEVFRAASNNPAVRTWRSGSFRICIDSNDRDQAACDGETDRAQCDSGRTFDCHRNGSFLKQRMFGSDDAEHPQRAEYEYKSGKLSGDHKQYVCIFSGCFGNNLCRDLKSDPSEGEKSGEGSCKVRREAERAV